MVKTLPDGSTYFFNDGSCWQTWECITEAGTVLAKLDIQPGGTLYWKPNMQFYGNHDWIGYDMEEA